MKIFFFVDGLTFHNCYGMKISIAPKEPESQDITIIGETTICPSLPKMTTRLSLPMEKRLSKS